MSLMMMVDKGVEEQGKGKILTTEGSKFLKEV
jgi:hypothetical protein